MTDTTTSLRVTLPRLALLEAIAAVVAHVVNHECPDPLGLFRATSEGLTLTASRGDAGARYTFTGVAMDSPGEVAILLKPLADVLRCSVGESVHIACTTVAIVVTIDSDILPARRFDFFHHDPQIIPVPDPAAAAESLALASADLRRLVRHVAFAAHDGKAGARRPVGLAGGLATLTRARLSLAATDTLQVAHTRLALKTTRKTPASSNFLLPMDSWESFAEVSRGCASVTLAFTDTIAALTAGPLFAWDSLLNASFPSVAIVLTERPHSITVSRARFLADVSAALVFTDKGDRVQGPIIVLAIAPGRLTISPESGQGGTCELVTPAPAFAGPRFIAAFHGQRLLNILTAYADVETVTLWWEPGELPHFVIAAGDSRCWLAPNIEIEIIAA